MANDINQIIDPKVVAELDKLNKQLIEAGVNIDKLIPPLNDLNEVQKDIGKSTGDNTEKRKRLTIAEKEARDLAEKVIANEAKIESLRNGTAKAIIKQTETIRKLTQAEKDKLRADEGAEGSLVRMRARLKELTAEYDRAGTRTKAATKEINDLSKEIMKAEQATNRHGRNVGNYTSAWDKFKDTASLLPGPLGNAANAAEGVVTKIAQLGPVGGIVAGTIVAAGTQLLAFFTKTEKGAEMLERKWSGMKAAWSVLVGEIASGGEKIADSFEENNKESTLWTGILSAINPRLAALGVRMDLASKAAEDYTLKIQLLEDAERAMIVPRAKANEQIKAAMLLYADQTKSVEVRMNALKTAINLENQTADVEIEHQKSVVKNIQTINEEKKKAGQLRDSDDLKLQEAMAREIELSTESMGRQIRATARINAARKEMTAEAEKAAEAEKKLSKERAKAWADETWAKQEQKLLQQKIDEKYLEDFAKLIDSELELEDAKQEKIIAATIAAGEKILDEKNKLAEAEKEQRLKNEEDFKQAAIQQGQELGNYLFESKKKQLDLEFQAAEGNAKKQAEIKKKIAQADKKQALFNIAVNTAVAVSKVLGQTGIFGLAAWIPIAALGAVQSAMVAAQKVPEFAKGTSYAPGGVAMVGEKGRELIKRPNGQIYLANNPALVNLERGSKVLTNRQTEQYLKDGNIVNSLSRVEKAIQRIPQPIFKNGSKIAERRDSYWKNYINQKHLRN